MKNALIVVTLLMGGIAIGSVTVSGSANAQQGLSAQGSDALWHLPKFGESGWFLHAHNGRVRACNMDGTSVAGARQAPKCSNWE